MLGSSLCHCNPTAANWPEGVDPQQDCGQAATWHTMASVEGKFEMYQACDKHLGLSLRMPGVTHYHEFGSACGLESSFWFILHNQCLSHDAALEMGVVWYSLLSSEWTERPEEPVVGTHIHETDTNIWYKWDGDIWWATDPPIGYLG